MGNDLNDIECIKKAGIGVAVADSYPQVLETADYITEHQGGKGAFREISHSCLKGKQNSDIRSLFFFYFCLRSG